MGKIRRPDNRSRAPWIGAFIFLALHVVAALFFPRALWGAHHVRYLSLPVQSLLAVAALLLLVPPACDRISAFAAKWGSFQSRRPRPVRALLLLTALILFYLLRSRNLFLGDGFLIEDVVMDGGRWEIGRAGFGGLAIYNLFGIVVRCVLPGAGGSVPFALLNPIAGLVYLLLAAAISREIAAGRGGQTALFFAFAFPGTLLFYFGYVEDYMWMHLALTAALLLMLRHLRGRVSWAAPMGALFLACLLHLSAIVLVPAWLLPLVLKIRTVRNRIMITALLLAAGGAGIFLVLQYAHSGYGGTGALLPLLQSGKHAYTLFSHHHFAFILNELMLVLGGALLLPFLAAGKEPAGRREEGRLIPLFLVALSLSGILFLVLLDPLLGSRDWDLMSLPVVPWVALLGALFLRGRKDPGKRAVTLVAGACVLHTLPWVLVNADRDRALAMTLDMVSRDGHYVESGAWANRAFSYLLLEEGYQEESAEVAERSVRVAGGARDLYNAGVAAAERGDVDEAIRWFRGAIAARADYQLPYHDLARLHMRQGFAAEAEAVLRERLVRGEDAESYYLLGLALGRLNRVDESIESLRRCVVLDSTHARAWGTLGVGYASIQRPAEARAALEKSLELDPDDRRIKEFLATLPAEGE